LDVQFVFTANPEDYTNRGAIITPLKDRIQSQILTHYPPTIEMGMRITAQELRTPKDQASRVRVPDLVRVLIERIAWEARDSEFVDRKSGVSARLTISALESVISSAERRALRNGGTRTVARIADLQAVVPAITGKIELVYEGELEGPEKVAHHLLGRAMRSTFAELFPNPEKNKKRSKEGAAATDPYQRIIAHFEENEVDLPLGSTDTDHGRSIDGIPGLAELVKHHHNYLEPEERTLWCEFVLHGLAEHSRIGRSVLAGSTRFNDLFNSMLQGGMPEDDQR
jgi:magnesium chelatase subunit I